MSTLTERHVFVDSEWHNLAGVPVAAVNQKEGVTLIRNLERSRIIDSYSASYLIQENYPAGQTTVMIRYQQYNTTGGYILRHYLNVAHDDTVPLRACLLIYGSDAVSVECGERSVNGIVQEMLMEAEVKTQCVVAIRTKNELRLVLIGAMGGLSYGKRSELASISLARMLEALQMNSCQIMMAINEQSKGSIWLQTGKFINCYKVHLPVGMMFNKVTNKGIGSVIFASYYTSFVLKGGSYGSRGFLQVVRLFYNSSFFCRESLTKPRLMMCQMKRICPSHYSLLYIGHDVSMRVNSVMSRASVRTLLDDYAKSKLTGAQTVVATCVM